ncbi:unnamed protein product [Penicillium salamii]|nr:unnamed protein product [Penicillium salamii]CAG8354621.1 unnamed protein product [Penicillium salamii]
MPDMSVQASVSGRICRASANWNRRRKKCTINTFPVCGDCELLNLECVREPIRQLLPVTQNLTSEPSSPWGGAHDYDSAELARRRSAMTFYVTTLSQLLTVSDKHNCFLSGTPTHAGILLEVLFPQTNRPAFLPMALESPALANALIAWSAGHLASREISYRSTALEARSKSLRSLALSLSSSGAAQGEINSATSLILMTSEVCLGFDTNWYRHLIGVKDIITSAQSFVSANESQILGVNALKQSPEGHWILRNFAYHDIIGSVTLGTKPLIQSQYLQGLTDVVDTYFGVASGILPFISEISCMEELDIVCDCITLHDENETMPNFLMQIEQGLKAWRCSSKTDPALTSLAYVYRSSSLIYLYRRTIRALIRHPVLPELQHQSFILELHRKIEGEVSTLSWYVESISYHEDVESALLFPLFIAGCETKDSSQMEIIRLRLELMHEKRHFKNIQQALNVLREIWEMRQIQREGVLDNCDVDWQGIVNSQEVVLLLT